MLTTSIFAIIDPTQERLVFGANLANLVDREGNPNGVPRFVTDCIEAIEAPKRIEREGIYRVNGNAALIQKLRVTVDDQVKRESLLISRALRRLTLLKP